MGTTTSFNGAATFRSRKGAPSARRGRGRRALQWGRDLSVAEGRWAHTLVEHTRRFNGAATFRSRKVRLARRTRRATRSFNGAATFRSRKALHCHEIQVAGLVGFNGAATFRSRKAAHCTSNGRSSRAASMGPRPFGRGRSSGAASGRPPPQRFNGAATFRSRKGRRPHQRADRAPPASMGPRPFGRGRSEISELTGTIEALLQWGRDLSVAEGGLSATSLSIGSRLQWGRDLSVAEGETPDGAYRAGQNASMGPRPFGRGRRKAARGGIPKRPASMGPRPFGRGRISVTRGATTTAGLQWGRDLSVAEGRPPALDNNPGTFCFNGAATFRSRKARAADRPRYDLVASMGPRPFGRGRRRARRCRQPTNGGFNGAATFRSRKAHGRPSSS